MNIKFKKLNKTIINCNECPRLINFIKKISTEKIKQNINDTYWGKPVTGFGKSSSKLLILGLAPAAHGGTRTGRPFTGDKSSDFLFKCLHKTNISNQPYSLNLKDGLKLKSTYITNILKCVPPGDKPNKEELNNCSKYFSSELSNLRSLKTIVETGCSRGKKKFFFFRKINWKDGMSTMIFSDYAKYLNGTLRVISRNNFRPCKKSSQ